MSAPVFSRYVGKMDKAFGSDWLSKDAPRIWDIMKQARVKSHVYAFDDQASFEMGQASALPPTQIKRMLTETRLPHDFTWVEYNWRRCVEGMGAGGVSVGPQTDDNPVRQGFLYFPLNIRRNGKAFHKGDGWSCVNAYLYDTDKGPELQLGTWVMGASYEHDHFDVLWRDNRNRIVKGMGPNCAHMQTAIGHAYCDMDWVNQPKEIAALRWLYPRLALQPAFATDQEGHWTLMKEVNGSTRLAVTLLAMATAAKPADKVETLTLGQDVQAVPRKASKPKQYPVNTVNLYLDPHKNPRPQAYYAKRALSAAERARKRLHDVEAHWCYRKPKGDSPGRSARDCPQRPEGGHVWRTHVFNEGWQQCSICDQERWPRQGHQRGDETLGAIGPKLRNVKL